MNIETLTFIVLAIILFLFIGFILFLIKLLKTQSTLTAKVDKLSLEIEQLKQNK